MGAGREQGGAGKEVWLGVRPHKDGVGMLGWIQSGALQSGVAGDEGWQARLRGEGKEWWNVDKFRCEGSRETSVAGQGLRGAVVAWCLPACASMCQ